MRTLDANLRNAINLDGSYYILVKADVYPTRMFWSSLSSNGEVANADAFGVVNDPMRQDIQYSATTGGLVTFWCDTNLKYAKQGATTVYNCTTYSSSVKPGVINSKLYLYNGTNLLRYAINWTTINGGGTTPLTLEATGSSPGTVVVVHGVSDTIAAYLKDDNGGLRPCLMDGTTLRTAPIRFMSPSKVEWDEHTRTMKEMALFSGAAALNNKVFIYLSNPATGMVEGIYYDTDNATWSEIFTVLPTDLEVSQCQFRIANAYTHNGSVYLCGMFYRTDTIGYAPGYYTLLLRSEDAKTFSVDRNVLVSNFGLRFLARVGSNSKLYLGNCNRVCHENVTWYFDGINGTGVTTAITADDIKGFTDNSLESAVLSLRAGKEEYFGHANVTKGAKVKVSVGMKATTGDLYTTWGTYIINDIEFERGVGVRGTTLQLTHEAIWKLSGLSMPFYAEILGKSCQFDPLDEDASAVMTPASGVVRTRTSLGVDFWHHVPCTRTDLSTTGIDMHRDGGVGYYVASGSHTKLAIVHDIDLKDILDLKSNPKITATTINCYILGWSHPITETAGQPIDTLFLILVTADPNGVESWGIYQAANQWPKSWPDTAAGTFPATVALTGAQITIGHTIKKLGVAFSCSGGTWFNIARVDIRDGVEVYFNVKNNNTPWAAAGDGSYTIPEMGRPYIMFSPKPFDSFDFSLVARFSNPVTGTVSGYPVACGLVGLAEDGANYIVGRYNKTNNRAEIVKCRAGVETVLGYTDVSGWTIGNPHSMRFDHKGGRFELFIEDTALGYLKSAVVYEWNGVTQGFMYTSDTVTMKCGYYGIYSSPWARILGYYAGSNEEVSDADGIPFDPHFAVTDFPASGVVFIDENQYDYTGTIGRTLDQQSGPWQYRSCGIYSGKYGHEVADFWWTGTTSALNGYLTAVDTGANFLINEAYWQPTSHERARYYSANEQISKLFLTGQNRVWTVGGLSGVTLRRGTRTKHDEGSIAQVKISNETLRCWWFYAAGGPDDTTVENLIDKIAGYCGVRHAFSGNTNTLGVQDYVDSLDLEFQTATPATISITTSAIASTLGFVDSEYGSRTGSKVTFTYIGAGVYEYAFTSVGTPDYTFPGKVRMTHTTGLQKFRVLYHDDHVSIYHNGKWAATWTCKEMTYPTYQMSVSSSGASPTNIVNHELSDWREAIYIDLETDGRSALSSVIQQRPVEVVLQPDGSVNFWYSVTRDSITAVREPRRHRFIESVPVEGASDAIIQGSKEVRVLQNEPFAEGLGFATKVMRMSDLDRGAYRAANLILQKAFERRSRHSLTIRPDLGLMPQDVYSVSYTAAGGGQSASHDVVVESVTLSVQMNKDKMTSSMQVEGREQYP